MTDLQKKLMSETILAKKPSGETISGSFVYEDDILYLCFDGNKKEFPIIVPNEKYYHAALSAAEMMVELFYKGVTEWAIPKDNYSY